MSASITMQDDVVPDLGKRKWVAFLGLLIAMFFSGLDNAVFGTALPTIVGELHGVEHMLWVTTAYILAMTVMLPVYGKFGDRFGHKRLFVVGIALFIAGSVIGGLAPDMTWLIIGRAVQGIGGGGLIIQVMAILPRIMTKREQDKSQWAFGLMMTVPMITGPIIGGLLTSGPGWRWVFWINIPGGLIALLAAWVLIPKLPALGAKAKVDYAGICLLAAASTAIVLVTSWGGSTYAWSSPLIMGLIAVGLICVAGFIYTVRNAVDPIMPRQLFKNRNFVIVTVAGLVLGIIMMGVFAYLPTYMQMVSGVDVTESGYLMIPMILSMLVVSGVVSAIAVRTGRYKPCLIAGMAVMSIALWVLSTMTPSTTIVQLCAYLALMGAGLGMTMAPMMRIVQNEFSLDQVGTAVSTNTYFRTMGMSLGAAVVGAIFTSRLTSQLTASLPGMPVGSGGVGSLTPAVVQMLPEGVRDAVISAYSNALAPIYLWVVPLSLAVFVMLWFMKEAPRAEVAAERLIEPVGI